MNKIIVLLAILVLVGLTACGSASGENTALAAPVDNGSSASSTNGEDTTVASSASNEVVVSTTQLGDKYENALPVEVQLALGTILLEEDSLAVDAIQASDLLPLWRAVQSLTASGTAADAEITAVLNQIQAGMTVEQIAAIADMQLTQEAMRALVQDGVIAIDAGDVKRGSSDDSARGGGPPGGGGGPLGGQTDPARQTARQAEGGGENSLLNQAATQAVVRMLEMKAN